MASDELPTVPPPSEGEDHGVSRPTPSIPPPHEHVHEPIARFGRFDLLGRLDTGGMADVFLARESLEGAGSRQTAIKVIRGEFSEDGEFARMFMDEGRLAMRLTHPNICTVYECGRHEGRFFMAMELIDGQTLRDVLVRSARRKRPIDVAVLLKIFAIVAEALDFAHRAKDAHGRPLKIVHRDVSPHNVMVRYDGVVKLLDFGVAQAEQSAHETDAGAVKGKFSYMSPEQALAEPIDARADIFALGVCIFEAVTGRRLFHRKAQYDTLKAILEQDPPPLADLRPDVPAGLDPIIARALAKDRNERYQSASELQDDIERLLSEMRSLVGTRQIGEAMTELFAEEMHRGPTLDRSDEVRRRFPAVREPEAPPQTVAAPARAPKRSAALLTAAGLVALLGLGIGGWLAMGAGAEPPVATELSESIGEDPVVPPGDTDGTLGGPASTEADDTENVESDPPGTQDIAGRNIAGPEVATDEATDEDPEGAESSPSTTEDEPTHARRSRRRSRRGRARRRTSGDTVFVADPGF